MATSLDTGNGTSCRSDWMAQLPENVHNIPLRRLSIPGSHNSCTYWLDCESAPCPSCPEFIVNLCQVFGPPAKQIVYNWAVCQSLTVPQQLDAGIRYLDLRVTSKPGSTDLFFEHDLYGENIPPVLLQINEFLNKHPKEIIFLDFNHFTTNLPESSHHSLIAAIKETFGSKLCAISDANTLTLTQMWESQLQVIVFYHNEICYETPEVWPPELVSAPWAQTTVVEDLVTFLENATTKGLPDDIFYVTQGILTPSPQQMVGNLGSNLKDALAVKAAPAMTEFTKRIKDGNGRINIFIIDFVELNGFIDSVIGLNHKD